MSGLEIAGIALGVPSLALAAWDAQLASPSLLLNHESFNDTKAKVEAILEVQRALFHNDVLHLLRQIMHEQEVRQMLMSPSARGWTDPSLNEGLVILLDAVGSREAWLNVVKEIHKRLEAIHISKRKIFGGLDLKRGSRIRNVSARLILSLKETQLIKALDELRTFTKDFLALNRQILRHQKERHLRSKSSFGHRDSTTLGGPSSEAQTVHRQELIRKTSIKLYDSLEACQCVIGSGHDMLLDLENLEGNGSRVVSSLQPNANARFNVGYDLCSKWIWFTATSQILEEESPRNNLHTSTDSPRAMKQSELSLCKKLGVPNGQTLGPTSLTLSQYHEIAVKGGSSPHQLDSNRLLQSPICAYFRIESPLLTTINDSESRQGGLSITERIQLARYLARSVLQLWDTPWLQGGIDSKTIRVLSTTLNPRSSRSLIKPFVYVPCLASRNKTVAQSGGRSPIIANYILFQLAVVMIELAYNKPLTTKTLARATRSDSAAMSDPFYNTPGTDLEQFELASRICLLGGGMLGRRFNKVTEKCLRCDFGCGSNLEDPQLRALSRRCRRTGLYL